MNSAEQFEIILLNRYNHLTSDDFDDLIQRCEDILDDLFADKELRIIRDEEGKPYYVGEDDFNVMVVNIFQNVRRRRRMSFNQFKTLGKFCDYPFFNVDGPEYRYF